MPRWITRALRGAAAAGVGGRHAGARLDVRRRRGRRPAAARRAGRARRGVQRRAGGRWHSESRDRPDGGARGRRAATMPSTCRTTTVPSTIAATPSTARGSPRWDGRRAGRCRGADRDGGLVPGPRGLVGDPRGRRRGAVCRLRSPASSSTTPTVHGDDRGQFAEIYRASVDARGVRAVQPLALVGRACCADSTTTSTRPTCGTSCPAGRRSGWSTFATAASTPMVETHVLDAAVPTSIYIPSGVAHGYLALTADRPDLLGHQRVQPGRRARRGLGRPDAWRCRGRSPTQPVVSARDAGNPRFSWDLIPSFT